MMKKRIYFWLLMTSMTLLSGSQPVKAQSFLEKMIEQAQKSGAANDQLTVFYLYYKGMPEVGAPKDLEQAKLWLDKALAQGDKTALDIAEDIKFDTLSTVRQKKINYALSPEGTFLADGKESIVLDFPGLSAEQLFTKFSKGSRSYEEKAERADHNGLAVFDVEDVAGKEVSVKIRLTCYKGESAYKLIKKGFAPSGSFYELFLSEKLEFKPGRVRITLKNDENELFDNDSFSGSRFKYYLVAFFKDGKIKSDSYERVANRLADDINRHLKGIVAESENAELAEDDW